MNRYMARQLRASNVAVKDTLLRNVLQQDIVRKEEDTQAKTAKARAKDKGSRKGKTVFKREL